MVEIYFFKTHVSESNKVVYGRPSTKWTSWEGKDTLVSKSRLYV